MRLVTLLIFSSLLAGCALFEERRGPELIQGPREQIYGASFEEVWKAVNLVLQPYPLTLSNMDHGVIETDNIRGTRIWAPPFKVDTQGAGETYKLTVRVVKGNQDGRPATKVTILKSAQLAVDFFSDPKPLNSNGLEEKMLLYRVGREIAVDRALARAQKKYNQQSSGEAP